MMKKLILIFILGVCCAQCSDDNISPNFNDSQKNLSKSSLWFQNSKNPYESLVGDNILAAIDSANAIGDNLTCDKDKLDDQAIKWFENVSDFYHASVSFPVDTSLLIITSTELDYFDEITSELYSGDSLNNSLHNLIAIEDELVNS